MTTIATLELPQNRTQRAAMVLSLVVILILAIAVIGFFNDKKALRPYWGGFTITGVSLLLYFALIMPSESNGHVFYDVANLVFESYVSYVKTPTGSPSEFWYVITLSSVFEFWIIPILGHIGGSLGLWFARRKTRESRDN